MFSNKLTYLRSLGKLLMDTRAELGDCTDNTTLSSCIRARKFQSFVVIMSSSHRLYSGASDPGSSPGWGIALCSWTRHFTPTVPLSTQVCKWVLANLMLGGNRAMD